MLRIKPDIDLKELEKYGFKKEYDYYQFRIDESEYLDVYEETRNVRLFIEDEYYNCCTGEKSFDLLYDLIQDGLVIKE